MEYSIFNGLDDSELKNIYSLSHQQTYQKNDIIFNVGESPDYLYLFIEGLVYICEDSRDGHRNILTIINKKHDCFGEVYLFKNVTFPYYSLAMDKTTILKIPKEVVLNQPKLNVNLNFYFANKAYTLSKKLQLLMKDNLREKILEYLKNHQDTTLKRYELAEYLNVSRPALSRELYAMMDESLIEINTKGILKLSKR